MAANIQPKYDFIRLKTKPQARLSYSFSPAASASASSRPALVVFLNGLGLPQAGWTTAILKLCQLAGLGTPAILTYDRYGQGRSVDRDPGTRGGPGSGSHPAQGHDCLDAVRDLRQLVGQIAVDAMGLAGADAVRLVLVGHALGCAIARLYAYQFPGTVSGLLLLDSTLTDTDFVSLFPDPDVPNSQASSLLLPSGLSPDHLRAARQRAHQIYHPDAPNKEGLSRHNLPRVLPRADSPRLVGPDGQAPYVTVVGHDPDVYARETRKTTGIPAELVTVYVEPHCQRYSEGLARLGRSRGPLRAPGSGHFVQVDNPSFVAERLYEMLQMVR